MTDSSCFILINTRAGSVDRGRLTALLESVCPDLLAASRVVFWSPDESEVDPVVKTALEQNCRRLLVGGGDGTVSSIARLVVGKPIRLGILPLGTANLIARELTIPLEIDLALRIALESRNVCCIDGMQADETLCFSHISVGTYARVAAQQETERSSSPGIMGYLKNLLHEVSRSAAMRYRVSIDGQKTRRKASMLLIANVGVSGVGEARWGDAIRIDDGQLELCQVRTTSVTGYLRLLYHAFRQRIESSPEITVEAIRDQITIEGPTGMPVRGDGEIISHGAITVTLRKAVLPVIVQENSASPSE